MKLLVLSTWFPYPADNGSRLRAWHLLRRLRAEGHQIHLIAGVQEDLMPSVFPAGELAPATIAPALAAICDVDAACWRWYRGGGAKDALAGLVSPVPISITRTPNPRLQAVIARGLDTRPDAVLVLELGMDAYLPAGRTMPPLVLDQVEVSGAARAVQNAPDAASRLRARLTWQKGRAYWHDRFKRYQALTAVSEAEAGAVRAVAGRDTPPVVMLPNGVDVGAYPSDPPRARVPDRLLYNGALTYGPNRDAIDWFTRDILPLIARERPRVHLFVTGRFDPNGDLERRLLADERVTLTGFVPDLGSLLAGASACVVPLRSGGGTRLKILEAWAAHLPVVSTAIGAAGLDGAAGTHLEVADTDADFARATVELLRDPTRAACLARNARALARTRYDWNAIGSDLSALLERIACCPRP